MSKKPVIAIDGPSGSGKSSLTASVSQELNLLHINTGAMFRAIGIYFNQNSAMNALPIERTELLNKLNLEYGKSETELIVVNGVNKTEELSKNYVSALASTVSQWPEVREFLLYFQRSLVEEKTCIMEGRDIGTVVFPDAALKIFLTAQAETRAKRRHKELIELGQEVEFEKILAEVKERDHKDMTREIAPLKMASDALEVDSSDITFEETRNKIVQIIKEKMDL